MIDLLSQIAFFGMGGAEFLLIMFVLLMLFGAKDAPRILRKINDTINQLRNTADGFKREIMYSDLEHEEAEPSSGLVDEDFDYGDEYHRDEDDDLEDEVIKVKSGSPEHEDDHVQNP